MELLDVILGILSVLSLIIIVLSYSVSVTLHVDENPSGLNSLAKEFSEIEWFRVFLRIILVYIKIYHILDYNVLARTLFNITLLCIEL